MKTFQAGRPPSDWGVGLDERRGVEILAGASFCLLTRIGSNPFARAQAIFVPEQHSPAHCAGKHKLLSLPRGSRRARRVPAQPGPSHERTFCTRRDRPDTLCGLDVPSDAGRLWVGRLVRCRAAVGWTSRPMQGGCGLDVSSDAGRRPAPPCSATKPAILPKTDTRTHCSARRATRVSSTPSLPGMMPGSLVRDARPTVVGWTSRPMQGVCGLDVSSDAGRRPAPPCSATKPAISPKTATRNSLQREKSDSRLIHAIAPRHDAGEPRAGRTTHCSGLDVSSDAGRLWVGRLVRCRAASRAALFRDETCDLPQDRHPNSLQREKSDSRLIHAIAPRHDAGEPRAGRTTHCSGLDVPSDAGRLWVGRPVRCRAASRAALFRDETRDLPEDRDPNSLQREKSDSRFIHAIAPRHDAEEPRAGRTTHCSGLDVPSDAGRLWVGRLVRCRAASRAALFRDETRDLPEDRHPNSLQREKYDSRLIHAIAPRHDAGEPRAGRTTHCSGLDVSSDAGRLWVGRLVRCRAASRAALFRDETRDPPEDRDPTLTATQEERLASHPRHRSPA